MSAHEWRSTKRDEWTFCAICGVVRSDDKETDCKGPTLHVDDYARGVADERERVVAWLESFGIGWFYAQRIERGEHEAIPKERHERKKLT